MHAGTNDEAAPRAALEIERKYLLTGRPDVPPEAERLRIEQGYLRPDPEDGVVEGRVRRIEHADGRVEHVHTVKTGRGLVREEIERTIPAAEYDRLWPRTAGARLRKTRFELTLGPALWVVDIFDDLDLVLAEVELPAADAIAEPPPWLAGHISREVTGEDDYRNFVLATRISGRR